MIKSVSCKKRKWELQNLYNWVIKTFLISTSARNFVTIQLLILLIYAYTNLFYVNCKISQNSLNYVNQSNTSFMIYTCSLSALGCRRRDQPFCRGFNSVGSYYYVDFTNVSLTYQALAKGRLGRSCFPEVVTHLPI